VGGAVLVLKLSAEWGELMASSSIAAGSMH
jgi:hypothetical protein